MSTMSKNARIVFFLIVTAIIVVFVIPKLQHREVPADKPNSGPTPIPKRAPGKISQAPDQAYLELRGEIFRIKPSDFGFKATKENPNVWGVVVDIGNPMGVATTISLVDGTTSLYTGRGGGILGGGANKEIAILKGYFPHSVMTFLIRSNWMAEFTYSFLAVWCSAL